MERFFYKLRCKLSRQECGKCPLSWEERNYYEGDSNCGCCVDKSGGDFDGGIWCFMPNWICKIKRNQIRKWEG